MSERYNPPDEVWSEFLAAPAAHDQEREIRNMLFASFDAHVGDICNRALAAQEIINRPSTQPMEIEQLIEQLNDDWRYHNEQLAMTGRIYYYEGWRRHSYDMTEPHAVTSRGLTIDGDIRADIETPYRHVAMRVEIPIGDDRTVGEGNVRMVDIVDIRTPYRSPEQLVRELSATDQALVEHILHIIELSDSRQNPYAAIEALSDLRLYADPAAPDGYALIHGVNHLLSQLFPDNDRFDLSYSQALRRLPSGGLAVDNKPERLTGATIRDIKLGPSNISAPLRPGQRQRYVPYLDVSGYKPISHEPEDYIIRCSRTNHLLRDHPVTQP